MLITDNTSKVLHIEPNIEVTLNRNIRAKRVLIRIKGDKVILTIPRKVSEKQALEFLHSKIDWVRKNITKPQKISFEDQANIRILGNDYLITHSSAKSRGIALDGNELRIYGKNINFDIRIKKFLTMLLRNKLTELATEMSKKLEVTYKKIAIKEMDSRWGSCSSQGNLAFSFKLVFTEPHILEYIVAHEVSHLREMNHSKNFWTLVESLYPNWQQARIWLKDHGKFVL
jgi:predicted metal-dependent hydrolase